MSERKNVMREKCTIYLDYESLDSAIKMLQDLAEKYGGSAVIQKTSQPYEDYEYLGLFVSEPETDGEMKTRLAREKDLKSRREAYERAEFERLSAKFRNQID